MMPELSRLELDPTTGIYRQSPPYPGLRPPHYAEEFDYHTVFYDMFRSADGNWVVCVGPPLFNLAGVVAPALMRAFAVTSPREIRLRNFERQSQLWIRSSANSAELPPGLFRQDRIDVQPNGCDLFGGKNVLLTLSRNNNLDWIEDWAFFHAKAHRCDAVLLYDNASTAYPIPEIEERLLAAGVRPGLVIAWPYKYGPVGAGYLESNFAQHGVLEQARHRFLGSANAVLSIDIDELVMTEDDSSIFDLACRSETGYLCFSGYSIENATAWEGDLAQRRHKHFFMTKHLPHAAQHKWAIVPSRRPLRSDWHVHHVSRLRSDPALADLARYCHFEAITDNWRFERFKSEAINPAAHAPDPQLVRWLKIFDRPRDDAASSSG
jgi:hypothetical protein